MKLTDHIHLLQINFEIALSADKKLDRFVNVLILFGDKITLIDTGVKHSERMISEYLRENNRDISEIDTVILSHSHPDHIGSAAKIKELSGCRILAHLGEKDWIENLELQNQQRPVPGFFNLADTPVKIDDFINDGEEIRSEAVTMKFIHSPGHSRGSLNILFKEDRMLFTADSIPLKNDIPNYDNFRDLMRTLESIKNNDQYEILLSSWTLPFHERGKITRLIDEGEQYMNRIDAIVKECYNNNSGPNLDSCQSTIEKLGLPLFMVNPIVDRAFRSH